MKWFFDMDNPVMSALGTAADLLILNLLTLLCCLPVVTAGAALTALNDLCIHLVRREEGSIVKGYFRSFRLNFKKGTLLGLLFLLAAALLYVDYLAALTYIPVMNVGIVALGLIVLALALYAFALLSRYENGLWATLKNAAALAVGFFPRTLMMLVFTVGLWLLGIHFVRWGAPVLLMFGFSLPAYMCALWLNGVFNKIEK